MWYIVYKYLCVCVHIPRGIPGGASGKEPTCQCRRHKRHRFHPWVGEIPWRRPWQHTPVFLPRESHGQVLRSVQQVGIKNGQRTVWEKGTRDRIRVLKMGPGNSRPLGSRALFLGATSLLFSVLASRKYLLCYDEVSLLCPRSHLLFY